MADLNNIFGGSDGSSSSIDQNLSTDTDSLLGNVPDTFSSSEQQSE